MNTLANLNVDLRFKRAMLDHFQVEDATEISIDDVRKIIDANDPVRGIGKVGRQKIKTALLLTLNEEISPTYETKNNDEIRTLRGHFGPVTFVVFSPDGSQLASAAWFDGAVMVC